MKRAATKRGAEGNKWATYIRAKQKGQIDLLLSLLAPACYKLSVPTTHMHAHTRTNIHTCTNSADYKSGRSEPIWKLLSGKDQEDQEEGEQRSHKRRTVSTRWFIIQWSSLDGLSTLMPVKSYFYVRRSAF